MKAKKKYTFKYYACKGNGECTTEKRRVFFADNLLHAIEKFEDATLVNEEFPIMTTVIVENAKKRR